MYISRKAQKRQTLIVSLNDHNQQELRKVLEQKEKVIEKYTEEKKGGDIKGVNKHYETVFASILVASQ